MRFILPVAIPVLTILLVMIDLRPETPDAERPANAIPHIVFVTGDEEYRSEESMPMLARILERNYGFKTTVCFATNAEGNVDPNVLDNIAGLEALDTADMMVVFTRFRALPDDQLKRIVAFAESGKPMAGFRTATHAFQYKDDPSKAVFNETWPATVFGQHWITHHGHFEDGGKPLTDVQLIPWKKGNPILRGVAPFQAYSWLYHVDGGAYELQGDSKPLLTGTALRSNHQENNRLDEFPLTNPVAWTKTYTGTSGHAARVFFTTLGHPYDFKETSMRRLAVQGILWALGEEERIPEDGADVRIEGVYEPNNSGFGDQFKPNLKPEAFLNPAG
ncbi:MAG: ThuA domain-containing protein [Rhodothermales bacterium]